MKKIFASVLTLFVFCAAVPFTVLAANDPYQNLFYSQPVALTTGVGIDGADVSAVDATKGRAMYGFGVQTTEGYIAADDFVATRATHLTGASFYVYQTGSGTVPTITELYVQIYDGNPKSGGNLVWGDTTTNLLDKVEFTGWYRAMSSVLTNADRPIMEAYAELDVTLTPGTYWIAYSATGSGVSGPWGVPTIKNDLTDSHVYNAIQYGPDTWNNLLDNFSNEPLGVSFNLYGYDIQISLANATRIANTKATVSFTSSENGEYYYAVVPSGANEPNIVTDGTGVACVTGKQTISIEDLTEEATDLYVVVKAADGLLSNVAKITIPRFISDDGSLAKISSSLGTLSPAFDKDVLEYTLNVKHGTSSVTVSPVASFAGANITVNNAALTANGHSNAISLVGGKATIVIEVTAENGALTTYTINVLEESIPTSSPETGDNSPQALLWVTGISLLALAVVRKKRSE